MRFITTVIRCSTVVALVGFGLIVLMLVIGVAPAVAAPGPIGGLASPSHPDEASWYANPNPSLSWNASLGVAGYSYLIDRTSGTNPPATITRSGLRFSSTTLTAGLRPEAISSDDLNGDGKADLVVADYDANTISVFLGNGDGTFQSPVAYPVGTNPHGVAIADLNGDGKLDVVIANWGGANVSVLLGNGDGTLRPAVAYSVGANPSQIAIGDFNRDGAPDLAVATYAISAVRVLLGNGNGTFGPAKSYPTATNAEAITTDDFDGDGELDLAVADWTANSVSILLGNRDGTFKPKVDYPVGTHAHSVVAGDFNGDGARDLAVANWFDGTISVLLGRGNGTFGTAATYVVGASSAQLALADFNGDGILDLAVANRQSANAGVLLGKGDGTFMAFQGFATPTHPHAIVAGDFNGDGMLDLAMPCDTIGGTSVGLLLNTTMTPFTAAYSHLTDGVWYFHVCAIDTAGAVGPTAMRTVRVDTVAPITTDNANPGGLSTWHAGPWSLALSPTDPPASDGSHSGMVGGAAQTQYSLDNGVTWQTGTAVAFPRWKRGGGSGSYVVRYRSTDAAGNLETNKATTVRIDNSLPVAAASPSAPGNPATVTLTATDPDSGVAYIWYSLDGGAWIQAAYPSAGGVAVSIAGLGVHTLLYYAVDVAGNSQAGFKVATVTISASGSATPKQVLASRHRMLRVGRGLGKGRRQAAAAAR